MKSILKQIIASLLAKEAALVLKKYKPQIVAITGTVGKTSTKDAVHAALSRFAFTRKSPKSFNSEIGIPLTILGAKNPTTTTNLFEWLKVLVGGIDLWLMPHHYPEWLVLEVGADKPGDIKNSVKLVKPDVVIVTKLSKVPVHVEAFASPEALFEEKGELVKALKHGGVLILNADDEDVLAYKNLSDEEVFLFGNANGSSVRAENYEVLYDEHDLPKGISFVAHTIAEENGGKEEALPIVLEGTLGKHHTYHVLAALAVIHALGDNLSTAAKAFQRDDPTLGRMHLIPGIKDSVIIDDSYNSSPVALSEALATLKSLKQKRGRRKIAVLGDMLELGKFSLDEHKKAGEAVAEVADILVTVGVRARAMAEGALDSEMDESNIFQFDESREAGAFVQNLIKAGDIILVKGSQSIRTERVIEEIMADPDNKEKLLVRQDEEWVKRG